jgi:SAM-dependent methyltransferase
VDDYRSINRANWDERVPVHATSAMYGLDRFRADPRYLSHEVRFDRARLGDVTGLRAAHLQCHIGTDTLSLARLGAAITGLDFSPAAIEQARALAATTGAAPSEGAEPEPGQAGYVVADAYDAVGALGEATYDLVYTGNGALCWLPDIERWAGVVSGLLRPGGRLFLREGHPMLWALDDPRPDRVLAVEYPYFERPEPIVFADDSTYVESDTKLTNTLTHSWNHGLGEVVTALLGHGMTLTMLVEHDSVPWESMPGQVTRDDDGEWRLTDRPWRLAQSYTLQAVKG